MDSRATVETRIGEEEVQKVDLEGADLEGSIEVRRRRLQLLLAKALANRLPVLKKSDYTLCLEVQST